MSVDFQDYIDHMAPMDPELQPASGEMEVVPPGEYEFEITDAKQELSKSDKPMITLSNKVVSDGPHNGMTMRSWFSLQADKEFCRRRLRSIIEATGVPVDDRGGFSVQAFVGCRYGAKVIKDEWTETDPTTGEDVPRSMNKIVAEFAVDNGQPA